MSRTDVERLEQLADWLEQLNAGVPYLNRDQQPEIDLRSIAEQIAQLQQELILARMGNYPPSTDTRPWEQAHSTEDLIKLARSLNRDYIDRVSIARLEQLQQERDSLREQLAVSQQAVKDASAAYEASCEKVGLYHRELEKCEQERDSLKGAVDTLKAHLIACEPELRAKLLLAEQERDSARAKVERLTRLTNIIAMPIHQIEAERQKLTEERDRQVAINRRLGEALRLYQDCAHRAVLYGGLDPNYMATAFEKGESALAGLEDGK